MNDIELPLSQEDIGKINQLIEAAYYKGYEQGKQDATRSAEILQGLRDTIKRQEEQPVIRWQSGSAGGVMPLGAPYPYSIYGTGTPDSFDSNDSIDHMQHKITCEDK